VKLSQLFIKPDVSPVVTEVSLNTSLIQEEIVPVRPLTIEIKPPESDKKRQNSKESIVSTPIIVQKPAPVKLPVLDKQNSKLFEQFRSIVGTTDMSHKDYKLNYDSFKEFLNLRYPAEMTEVMLRWLYHGLSVNFEGWVQDMQKFINFSQEKHARVAFELFDFNRDRYICTADAFHIISLNNSIIFDQDIVRIRQAFIQKTQNELNSARMSARKKKNTKNKAFTSAEDENKFKVPSIHPSKPEALTLEDFLKVQFPLSKPQIIIDIIKYLTGFDLVEFNQESIKQIKRKRSEEIVEEMILSPELREKAANDPRIFYYRDLENAMTSFSLPNAKSLLNKFNEMNIDGPSKLKEINYKSIIDYFPRYFGSDNPYILRSFHNLLSGPKNLNITKVSYLSALSLLFSVFSTQDETSNFFAFSIYDQNQDGQITCEEINRFFETLNEKTLMYKECLM
jgi:Ca2+-binding EF-hand superfamily protein/phage pi2 protein 07